MQDQGSSGGVKSPALASGNSLLAGRNSGIASSAADVERLSTGHSGKTSKQLDKIGTGKGSGNHVNAATSHTGVVGDAKGGDDFFDRRSDLTANDVAISLVRHGE